MYVVINIQGWALISNALATFKIQRVPKKVLFRNHSIVVNVCHYVWEIKLASTTYTATQCTPKIINGFIVLRQHTEIMHKRTILCIERILGDVEGSGPLDFL